MSAIRIAVALLRDEQGRILLVRKRGTRAFMQPGGKIEAGEQPVESLRRELAEELGLIVEARDLRYLGLATAPAANEPGMVVEAEMFDFLCRRRPGVGAELAESRWIDPAVPPPVELAPLTRDCIIPLAVARGASSSRSLDHV